MGLFAKERRKTQDEETQTKSEIDLLAEQLNKHQAAVEEMNAIKLQAEEQIQQQIDMLIANQLVQCSEKLQEKSQLEKVSSFLYGAYLLSLAAIFEPTKFKLAHRVLKNALEECKAESEVKEDYLEVENPQLDPHS